MANPAAFGPFHRVHTRKQSDAVALAQEHGKRVCGLPPNWGGSASVKAYRGVLPRGEHGIEFWTDARPSEENHPTPAYWREGWPGVSSHPDDMVCIEVVGTKVILEGRP